MQRQELEMCNNSFHPVYHLKIKNITLKNCFPKEQLSSVPGGSFWQILQSKKTRNSTILFITVNNIKWLQFLMLDYILFNCWSFTFVYLNKIINIFVHYCEWIVFHKCAFAHKGLNTKKLNEMKSAQYPEWMYSAWYCAKWVQNCSDERWKHYFLEPNFHSSFHIS